METRSIHGKPEHHLFEMEFKRALRRRDRTAFTVLVKHLRATPGLYKPYVSIETWNDALNLVPVYSDLTPEGNMIELWGDVLVITRHDQNDFIREMEAKYVNNYK